MSEDSLEEFYKLISQADGVSIAKFLLDYDLLFTAQREEQEVANFRLGRKEQKKLADEVSPVADYLKIMGFGDGRIRFPLDSNPPDCHLWIKNSAEPINIEVTLAHGKTRFKTWTDAAEASTDGIIPHLSVANAADDAEFDKAVKRGRVVYSADQEIGRLTADISEALNRKSDKKYFDHILIIEADLVSLSSKHWEKITENVRAQASETSFREIYVVGGGSELRLVQLKP